MDTECVSCGKEIPPNSKRNFCDHCNKIFDAGVARQKYIEQRAATLEEAKANGDTETVSKIMGEIAVDQMQNGSE